MIELERHGTVAVVTLRHGKANTLDLEICRELSARLGDLETGPSRAVVLTGSGGSFSAGVDLKRLVEGGADYVSEFLPALAEAAGRAFAFPKPVVAAINGHAIAGGCLIACAADHRLMVRGSAGIGVPELMVGVPFPVFAMEILRFSATSVAAQRLVTSGRILDSEEAVEVGLVDRVVESEDLLEEAITAARRMGEIPAPAFEITKRQLRHPFLDRLERTGAAIDREVAEIWARPETQDAVRSYVERTLGRSRR